MANEQVQSSPNYITMMCLIAKIFFISIQVSLLILLNSFANFDLKLLDRNRALFDAAKQNESLDRSFLPDSRDRSWLRADQSQ